MTRAKRVSGERPLFWVGSSKDDLLTFPESVKDALGTALSVAQFGGKHPSSKPWKGSGPGVFEIVEDYRGDTYRAVYTVKLEEVVYVLHAFQKKSSSRDKNAQTARRTDCTATSPGETALRGATWLREKINLTW